MEAKDTVIKEILATHGYTVEEAEAILNNAGRAIYQAGIREVVDYLQPHIACGLGGFMQTNIDYIEWQGKVKEWGINP